MVLDTVSHSRVVQILLYDAVDGASARPRHRLCDMPVKRGLLLDNQAS